MKLAAEAGWKSDLGSYYTKTEVNTTVNGINQKVSGVETKLTTISNPNLTPWFSVSVDNTDYWKSLHCRNTSITNSEGLHGIWDGEDGWAHVTLDSRTSAGNDGSRACYMNMHVAHPKIADRVTEGGTYTWLVEVRNLTWVGASSADSLRVCPSVGNATLDVFSSVVKTFTADSAQYGVVTAKTDFSVLTMDTRGYCYIPTGCYADFDLRISLYEGTYTGPYKPYVEQSLTNRVSQAETSIEQTANNVLIKATKSDTTAAQGGQHLIQSLINVAPDGVKIAADKVNIEGAAIFTSGRLSSTSLNNSYDAKGAASTAETNAKAYTDSVEIGGRNLFKSTTECVKAGTGTASISAYDYSYHGRTVTVTAASPVMRINNIITETNVPYTISFTCTASAACKVQIDVMDNAAQYANVPAGTSKVAITSTPTRAVDSTYHFIDILFSTAGTYKLADIMVEQSNKASSWSLAPEDMAIERTCTVGQNSSTTTNPWYRVASSLINSQYVDNILIVDVYDSGGYTTTGVNFGKRGGRLVAHARAGQGITSVEAPYLVWESRGSEVNLSDFVLAYKLTSGSRLDIELWCRCANSYQGYVFKVVYEGHRAAAPLPGLWVLYSSWAAGSSASITSGYTQVVSTDGSAAQETANANVKRTQRIYYRKATVGAPGVPTAWVVNGNVESSWTKYNAWSTRVPPIADSTSSTTKYLYLYTCEQYETAGGTTPQYTTVLLDDSTTIIDGGNIITGSIAANRLDVYDASINKIKAEAIDLTGVQPAGSYATTSALTTETNQRKAQYGTCSTAAGTAAKAVTCANFELVAGNELTVKFTTANTASAPTLNVNSKGAKNVWVGNAVTSATNQLLWGANAYITFRYDGTQFQVIGEPRTWYGACTTAEGTAAKTDTTAVTGCVVCKGAKVELAMTNANTAASPTLNIQSTGAKAVYFGNGTTRPTKSGGTSWLAANTCTFTFDGATWRTQGKTYIDANSIVTGYISADRIEAGSIAAGKLNANSIKSEIVQATDLSAAQIKSGKIDAQYIDVSSISIGNLSGLSGSIGGRNRLLNTENPTSLTPVKAVGCNSAHVYNGTLAYSDGIGTFTVTSSSGEKFIRFVPTDQGTLAQMGLPPNGSFVFSGYAKTSFTDGNGILSVRVQYYTNSWKNPSHMKNLVNGTETTTGSAISVVVGTVSTWTYFAVSMTIPSDVTATGIYVSLQAYDKNSSNNVAVNDTFQFRRLKFESGNVATDWTPAPEDRIETGGRNYAKTNAAIGTTSTSNGVTFTVAGPSTVKLSGTATSTGASTNNWFGGLTLEPGTYSLWLTNTNNGTIWFRLGKGASRTHVWSTSGNYTRDTPYVFKVDTADTYWFGVVCAAGTYSNIETSFMLERGSWGTSWVPATEDVSQYRVVTTNYSYTLSQWLTYSAEGYTDSWSTHTSGQGVRVGDTVMLKGTNKDTGDPVYVLLTINTLASSGAITNATSHGLIDPTAGTRADSYITDITSGGMMVHPSSDANTGVQITDKIDIKTASKVMNRIDTSGMTLYDGAGVAASNVVAKFASNLIELGKNSRNAVINMCNDVFSIAFKQSTEAAGFTHGLISSLFAIRVRSGTENSERQVFGSVEVRSDQSVPRAYLQSRYHVVSGGSEQYAQASVESQETGSSAGFLTRTTSMSVGDSAGFSLTTNAGNGKLTFSNSGELNIENGFLTIGGSIKAIYAGSTVVQLSNGKWLSLADATTVAQKLGSGASQGNTICIAQNGGFESYTGVVTGAMGSDGSARAYIYPNQTGYIRVNFILIRFA